jgi:hypothetical protein
MWRFRWAYTDIGVEIELDDAGEAGAVGSEGDIICVDDGAGAAVIEVSRGLEGEERPIEEGTAVEDGFNDVDTEGEWRPFGGDPKPVHIDGKGRVRD